jgi:kumamolisin
MPSSRYFTVVFRERERRQIEQLAEQVSTPRNPNYGSHLSRSALRGLVALDEDEVRAVRDWFTEHGMKVVEPRNDNRQQLIIQATPQQIETAFGERPAAWKDLQVDVRRAARIALPGRLAGYVQKISGALGPVNLAARRHQPRAVDPSAANGAPAEAPALTTQLEAAGGMTPADIRDVYRLPEPWDGTGETIAIYNMGAGQLDLASCKLFWERHEIKPPEVHAVQVGPRNSKRTKEPLDDLEVAMSVEWAGAVAPGARIVVYSVDPTVFADPWSTFLMEIIADEEFAPTIASISFVDSERDYYRTQGHRVIVGLLAQAACLGITVVAASGDWGPFDGTPRHVVDGREVIDAPWPHGVFPAVEEQVLGVGGTMITCRDPLTEIAWSGPPPLDLQQYMRVVKSMAGGGGFSDGVPIPKWQEKALDPSYSRGVASPAVVPYGRGFPDVALMASGPAIQPLTDDETLSCQAYQAVVGQGWVDYAGGTSLGAPIWAAILAIANQARRENGKGRVGWVNPLLYQLAGAQPPPFRPVLNGTADVVMLAVNDQGQSVPYHLDGYRSLPRWDPVTGLGVPDVSVLVNHLRGRARHR